MRAEPSSPPRSPPSRHDGRALALHGPEDFDPDSSAVCRSWRGRRHRDEAFGDDARADVAGIATITEAASDRAGAEGVTFEPLTEEHERLYSLVGWDRKFAAAQRGGLEHGLPRRRPERRRARQARSTRTRQRTPAMEAASLAPARRGGRGLRFTLVEEVASRHPTSSRTRTPHKNSSRGRIEVRVVSIQKPLAGDVALRPHHAAWAATPSRLGRRWISAPRKARCGSRTTSQGKARRRGHRCVLHDGDQHLDYDTFRSTFGANTTSDFRVQGALRDTSTSCMARDDPRRKDAQKTNAYQENRNLMLRRQRTRVTDPGLEILANDVRCTHGATVSRVDRRAVLCHGTRAFARRRREADRTRLLPGHPGPHRVRGRCASRSAAAGSRLEFPRADRTKNPLKTLFSPPPKGAYSFVPRARLLCGWQSCSRR